MSESRLELGRLGPLVEGYRVWLLECGYSPGTVEHELRFLGVLGRWMAGEDLAAEQLDGEVIAAFVEAHRARGAASPAVVAPRIQVADGGSTPLRPVLPYRVETPSTPDQCLHPAVGTQEI